MNTGLLGPEGLVDSGVILQGYDNTLYPETHMEGEYREVHSLMIDGGTRFGASTVAFDGQEELLWVGNLGVSLTITSSVSFCYFTSSLSTRYFLVLESAFCLMISFVICDFRDI